MTSTALPGPIPHRFLVYGPARVRRRCGRLRIAHPEFFTLRGRTTVVVDYPEEEALFWMRLWARTDPEGFLRRPQVTALEPCSGPEDAPLLFVLQGILVTRGEVPRVRVVPRGRWKRGRRVGPRWFTIRFLLKDPLAPQPVPGSTVQVAGTVKRGRLVGRFTAWWPPEGRTLEERLNNTNRSCRKAQAREQASRPLVEMA